MIRRLLSRPSGLIPICWLGLVVLCAAFASQIAPFGPNETDLLHLFEGPGSAHWLGTDELGRDVLSRLIHAARVALLASVQAVSIGVFFGVPVGMFIGLKGGWWDRIVMRLVDAVFSLPGLILAFAIVAILGQGLTNAMLAIGILFAMRFIRLSRGVVLSVREEPFIEAARFSGAPTRRILSRYILPNIAGPLIVQASLSFAAVLLIEAALSFLGIGVEQPDATWGTMLRQARAEQSSSPWLAIPPGLAITFTVLAFNTFGDTLRDLLADPDDRGASPTGQTVVVEETAVGLAPARTGSDPGVEQPASDSVDEAAIPTSDEPLFRDDALLAVHHLTVHVPADIGVAAAVSNVSFDVARGEILGLVGESGSGKTLTALAIAGLLDRGVHIDEDTRIDYAGTELTGLDERRRRAFRGSEIGMIFQDPMSSLNPALTVGHQLIEPQRLHLGLSKRDARVRAVDLLERVGVPDPASRLGDHPHQFSGGMAQRVMIAMVLSSDPALIIADEPTTALDVTTQRQVLELIVGACEELSMAMIFITHDLGVVAEVCDRAIVMYAGEAVEVAEVHDLFGAPSHPYTRALLDSVPRMDGATDRLTTIPGRVPSPDENVVGCKFSARCEHVEDRCTTTHPALRSVTIAARPTRTARCLVLPDLGPDRTYSREAM